MKETILNNIKAFSTERKMTVNTPLLLADPNKVWLIEKGRVNLSAVTIEDNQPKGKRSYFLSAQEGDLLMGIAPNGKANQGLVAEAYEDSILQEVSLLDIKRTFQKPELQEAGIQLVEEWIVLVFDAIIESSTSYKPQPDILLEVGDVLEVPHKNIISTAQKIVWYESDNIEEFIIDGFIDIKNPGYDCLFPISRKSYFEVKSDVQLRVYSTEQIVNKRAFWHGLNLFHETIFAIELEEQRQMARKETKRLVKKYKYEEKLVEDTLDEVSEIFNLYEDNIRLGGNASHSNFFNACAIVAKQDDIQLVHPPELATSTDPFGDIVRYSHIRYREIELEGEWYKKTGPAMLAFEVESSQPIAIIPKSGRNFEAYNPITKERVNISSKNADGIAPTAYMFYKSLPKTEISLKELIKFAIQKDKSDYVNLFLMGGVAAILGMIGPILTGILFDSIIPFADRTQLIFVALALFASSLAVILFDITRNVALLRIEGWMDGRLQTAIWDRLLELPTTFFRKYSAGDLASRAMGISRIRSILSGVVATSIIGGLFSSLNILLLFYYSTALALVAIFLVTFHLIVIYILGRQQVKKQKDFFDFQGKTNGIVLQLLSGVTKFRVSGTEAKAFVFWLKSFSKMKKAEMQTAHIQNIQHIFNTTFSLITNIVIFFFIVKVLKEDHMSTGEFLAFSAAYGSFVFAMTNLGESMLTVLQIFPLFNRTKPILDTLPENDATKIAPEKIRGSIEFSHVGFSYEKMGKEILKDVSFKIDSGDYIALIGESGSGKSTIIRLLLGFEKPNSGTIMFDGQDLNSVDTRLLRRQIGVVLQDDKLIPGDIFTNIIGSAHHLTLDDAWEAAKMAAFDSDIKQMPMGMHTVISEGGSTLSGGQRQRLMIARAIVHKPKILIFDEATSALDNRTQAIVTESLKQLLITRIVVAHRLSTIINSDVIYYLKDGLIAEAGNYQELIEKDGHFAKLAKRQIV